MFFKSKGEKSEKEMFAFNWKTKYQSCLESASKIEFFTENKVNSEIMMREKCEVLATSAVLCNILYNAKVQ